nr:hypothetical protein [Tanacetum cinerariifolium]
MEQPNPTFAKIPILETGKFKQWKFRIQQYLQNKHYALWEVIEFGDSYEAPQEESGTGSASESSAKKKGRTVVLTTKDIQKRRNDVKARTTLLLALPDEHQLRFSNSGKGEVNTTSIPTASTHVSPASADVATASISYDTVCAYIASQSNGSQIKYEDINQIDKDDIKEMDIKWNMALLSMRADRFWKKTGKKITIQGTDVAGFDKSKVEYFNCHKMGHFDRERKAPRSQDRGWDWSYMANEEENHALVADDEAPTEFALMAKTSSSSKNEVFDDSLCSKSCKKNTDSLNTKITNLNEALSDSKTNLYHYKLALSQVEARLVEFKTHEIKFCEKIRGLEFDVKNKNTKIKRITNELEQIKKEKEGLDSKLTDFESASKDLDTLLGNQRSDKNKEGLGYIYSPSKKDISWTRLLEFADDTITNYSKPFPSIESNSSDLQNSNSSVSEHGESSESIMSKPMIKSVKAADSPIVIKTNKVETVRKPSIKAIHRTSLMIKDIRIVVALGGGKITGKGIIKTGFLKPFGCHVMILNTLDHLEKFDAKGDEGYFIGYSMSSKAFRVFNKRTKRVEENLHVDFLEIKLIEKGAGLNRLFDIDTLTNSMNYVPMMVAGTSSTNFSGTKDAASQDVKKDVSSLRYIALPNWFHEAHLETSTSNAQDTCNADALESSGNFNPNTTLKNPPVDQMETLTVESVIPTVSSPVPTACLDVSPEPLSDTNRVEADLGYMEYNISAIPTPTFRIHKDHPKSQIISPVDTPVQTRHKSKEMKEQSFIATIHRKTTLISYNFVYSHVSYLKKNLGRSLVLLKTQAGTKWVLKNKKDGRGIMIRNKARLVAQGHTQEEGIDYEEVFAPFVRIKAIRLFLAYASFIGFTIYQMDVKYAFLYGTIDEEVYVTQPSGFQDPEFPDRVYKVEKTMYGLHQAPRAWHRGDFLLVQVHVDDIIFGSSNPLLCREFEALMHEKFQISAMDVRSANTPMDKENTWGKDRPSKDVELHLYRSMIRSLMYLTASRPDIMFVVCACARHQVTPKECHLHAIKRIFRYLKGYPKLGLWYPKDSPFDLVAYSDNDYGGATQDMTPKECHLHAIKRIFRYLKGYPKLGLWYPKDSPFDLVAYSDNDYGGATQDRKSTTGGC